MSRTSSNLLLLLAVSDIREAGDDEVGQYLEHLLGALQDDMEENKIPGDLSTTAAELQESIIEQMMKGAPDRSEVTEWLFEFADFLPDSMSGFSQKLKMFDELLETVFEDDTVEDLERVQRFLHCSELLEEEDWKQRSQAARGLANLEEEIIGIRDEYQLFPMRLEECSAHSVVTRVNLVDAFETWQKAISEIHRGELDEAVNSAIESACLFVAVERWAKGTS